MGWVREVTTQGVGWSSEETSDLVAPPLNLVCMNLSVQVRTTQVSRYFINIEYHQDRSNVYSQLSGLEDVVFNFFIKDDFIPEGDGQVA